jgi:uncharacterized protein involved in copper resistance
MDAVAKIAVYWAAAAVAALVYYWSYARPLKQARERAARAEADAKRAEQETARQQHDHEQEARVDEAERQHDRVDGMSGDDLLDDARRRVGSDRADSPRQGLFNPPDRRRPR